MINETKFTIRLIEASDPAAKAARDLIIKSFSRRLSAFPKPEHKRYLVVEAETPGREPVLAACSSIYFAREDRLFSETYLTSPLPGGTRDLVCEIGSLSTNPTLIPSVCKVVAYFPWFATRFGCQYALVTVTSYMREALQRAGTPFLALCDASPEKLALEQRSRWGNYYDWAPQTGIITLAHLNFLEDVVRPGVRPEELVIQLGCFGRAVI